MIRKQFSTCDKKNTGGSILKIFKISAGLKIKFFNFNVLEYILEIIDLAFVTYFPDDSRAKRLYNLLIM